MVRYNISINGDWNSERIIKVRNIQYFNRMMFGMLRYNNFKIFKM